MRALEAFLIAEHSLVSSISPKEKSGATRRGNKVDELGKIRADDERLWRPITKGEIVGIVLLQYYCTRARAKKRKGRK